MHKLLDKFEDWKVKKYGMDAFGNKVKSPDGFKILAPGSTIPKGCTVFDVYAGWMFTDEYHSQRGHHVQSGFSDMGRWQAWAEPISGEHK